jgi:hypothetical protein
MLREVGAMDQLEQLIDRIPMNGYGQPGKGVGVGREGTGAWYDEAIISANADTSIRIPFRRGFSFFSITLAFIYKKEIRNVKSTFVYRSTSLFPISMMTRLGLHLFYTVTSMTTQDYEYPLHEKQEMMYEIRA